VDYESTAAELKFAHGGTTVSLLEALSQKKPVPADLECGEYRVMLDGVNDSLHVRMRRVI
jgi:hypothetical protein